MDAITKAFIDYGLAGVVIAALFFALHFVIKEHREERKLWLDAYKDNIEVLRGLSSKCGISHIKPYQKNID